MARAPTMVVQDDYIDMDLSPSSPKCALLEFEFQSAGAGGGGGGGGGVSRRREEAVYASPADELFYRGKLLPLHLPPRLQLVQKLLQEQQVNVPEIKPAAAEAAPPSVSANPGAEVEDGGEAKAGAKRYSWSKRLKLMKRWTSREYIKSLFLAKAGDLGIGNGGCGRERAGLLDQDELCSHRRSFSGIIRRVRLVVATKASAPPGTSPLCSSSASSSSSSTPSCGNAERFFLRPRAAAMPVLKRSSSAGSEEGAIQGAIAHCKRSHQQLLQQGRKSASGVVFYSVSNTPRISTSVAVAAAAANESSQERQEMCRG